MPQAGDIYIEIKEYPADETLNVAHHICHVLIEPDDTTWCGKGFWRCNFGFYYAKDAMIMLPVNMNNGYVMFNPENEKHLHIGSMDDFVGTGLRNEKKKRIDVAKEIAKMKKEIAEKSMEGTEDEA